MVVAAQQGEVGGVGWAAVGVVVDVVGVAVVGGSVTSGEDASVVADGESASLCGGGVAFVAATGDGVAAGVGDDPRVGGVTGEHLPFSAGVSEWGAGEVAGAGGPVDRTALGTVLAVWVVVGSGEQGAVMEQVGCGVDVEDEGDIGGGGDSGAGAGGGGAAFDEVDEGLGEQFGAGWDVELGAVFVVGDGLAVEAVCFGVESLGEADGFGAVEVDGG